jgi:hypothetical protein
MKLVVFLSMVVIFISCFFIFFTFDSMVRSQLACEFGKALTCSVTELNFTIIFGIMIVGMLLFVDALVIYIMIKTWIPGLFVYGE